MTHLLILCEGDTEKRILKSFLQPYWQQRFDTIEVLAYSGNGELKNKFKADVESQLLQESDSSVLCLVDLYEEPFKLYEPHKMTIAEGFEVIQHYMYQQIASKFHNRFGAFPVVMEIETWLFGDEAIQKHLGENILEPETIKHPCGFLDKNYQSRNRSYGKIIDGVSLFGKADAKRVYDDNCPHFQKLVDWLIAPPVIWDDRSESVKQALHEWEQQRDEKYQYYLELEKMAETDADLDRAIQAQEEYEAFLSTYNKVFKQK
jgi:hypothetical protein